MDKKEYPSQLVYIISQKDFFSKTTTLASMK